MKAESVFIHEFKPLNFFDANQKKPNSHEVAVVLVVFMSGDIITASAKKPWTPLHRLADMVRAYTHSKEVVE